MPERIVNIMEIKFIVLMLLSWAARLAFRSGLDVGLIVRQLIISIFVGYIASEYILETEYLEWIEVTIFCVAVFLADDILTMILAFAVYCKENQKSIFKKISSFFGG